MKRVITGLVLSSIAGLGLAESVTVGRAEVKLPGDNWQIYPIGEEVSEYGGDRSGQVTSQRKIFVKKSSANTAQAVVLISSSIRMGTLGVLRYTPNCPSDEHWYRQGNTGFNRPFLECLGVLRGEPVTMESLQGLIPELSTIPTKLQMAQGAYTFISTYRNRKGTFLTVKLFLASDFALNNPGGDVETAEGVETKVMQYGTQLANAVRASVTSWSGALTLPSFSFNQP